MKKKTDYIWVVVILLFIATLTYRDVLIETIVNTCKKKCIDNDNPYCYEDCFEGLEAGMVKIPK